MTIADNLRKAGCFILVLALLATCLCSCSSDNDFSEIDTLNSSIGEGIDTYHILFPTGCSAPLASAVDRLSEALSRQLGVECKTDYDTQSILQGHNVMPFYIGNSANMLDKYTENMRASDYVYRVYDEFILLGGYSDTASINAIDRFLNDVLPECDSKDISEYEGNFLFTDTYDLQSVLLCGYDIGEFDICIPFARQTAEERVAVALHEEIVELCGARSQIKYLPMQESGKREIVFLSCDGEGARICYDGEDILFKASDSYGFSILVQEFYSLLADNICDGSTSIDIIGERTYSYASPTVNIKTYIPNNIGFESMLDIFTMIDAADADILIFGVMEKEFAQVVGNKVSRYTFRSASVDRDNVFVIAYKDTVSGYRQSFDVSVGSVVMNVTHVSSGESFCIVAACETNIAGRDAHLESFTSSLEISENDAIGIFVGDCLDAIKVDADGFVTCSETVFGALGSRVGVYAESGRVSCDVASESGNIISVEASKKYCEKFLKDIGK